MKSIETIRQEIADEFNLLDGDMEMIIFYIMELGEKLPPMDEKEKTEDNLVTGCQSNVWITASLKAGKVLFQADSNTAITKGLVSLLVRIFSGHTPETITQTEPRFMHGIGIDRFVGTQRSNGLNAMLMQIKRYALAFQIQKALKA